MEHNLHPADVMDTWRPLAEAALAGAPLTSLDTTVDGLVLQPLYGPAVPSRLGRIAHGPWERITRVDGHGAAPRDDLENGATSLALVFAGAPSAYGQGLLAETLDELDADLAGVMLDLVPLQVEAGARAIPALALVVALTERRGTPPAALHGGLDLVGAFAADGTLADIPSTRAGTASAARAVDLPGTLLLADGRPVAEAGGSGVTELAFALHSLAGKLRGLDAEGIPPAQTLPRTAVALTATSDLYATIAKLRAARRLHRLVADAVGVAVPLRLHVTTAHRMLAASDPETNILRLTLAAFAAGVGGADAVTVLPCDLAGSPFGRRIARNIQSLLIEEAHLARIDDPAAGAGAIEAATDALAEAAWTLFQEIDGDPDLLPSGRLAARVAADAAADEAAIRSCSRPIVGVTIHPLRQTAPIVASSPVAVPARRVLAPASAAFADLVAAAHAGATLADLAAPFGSDALTCPPLRPVRLAAPFGG